MSNLRRKGIALKSYTLDKRCFSCKSVCRSIHPQGKEPQEGTNGSNPTINRGEGLLVSPSVLQIRKFRGKREGAQTSPGSSSEARFPVILAHRRWASYR